MIRRLTDKRTGPVMKGTPRFHILTLTDCEKILERNHVGRLAFRKGETVDIEPLGYMFGGSWLFFRSAYGAKLEALEHNPYAAFEVDEIEGPFDWRSIVAHGTIYLLPSDGAPIEQREFRRAIEALRRIQPDALLASDPVPERQIVYGLHIDRLDGRMAQSRAPKQAPRRAKASAKRSPTRRGRAGGL